MTKNTKNLNQRLAIWAVIVAAILMIPLVLQAPWTLGDFVFAGVVLYSLAAVYEFTTKNMKNNKHKFAVVVGILTVIILILGWAATGPD